MRLGASGANRVTPQGAGVISRLCRLWCSVRVHTRHVLSVAVSGCSLKLPCALRAWMTYRSGHAYVSSVGAELHSIYASLAAQARLPYQKRVHANIAVMFGQEHEVSTAASGTRRVKVKVTTPPRA